MYSYFNPNPNGRNVSDCTVRAICKATGKDWGEVYLALCIQGYLDGDLPNANAFRSFARALPPLTLPVTRGRVAATAAAVPVAVADNCIA